MYDDFRGICTSVCRSGRKAAAVGERQEFLRSAHDAIWYCEMEMYYGGLRL